ncbi:hypothetical protein BC938DRAFT_481587 [Jimgerdemannia flammicorona]|uniref:RRM domain-containing protein n=1 Tax=Jimgerdemannia flammicorona TaxID=994334 RepID=A0A433QFR4_9FUNG|nr:hypothetical protein BC938DRAFT_481587 [Jimgerdemannia flammicorona]
MDVSWENHPAQAVPQQDNASSDYNTQVILSEIPAGMTSIDILQVLVVSYRLGHAKVSLNHDNTATVNELSAEARTYLFSLGRINVTGYLLNVRKPPNPYDHNRARTDSFASGHNVGNVIYDNPHTFQENLPYPQPGDGRYAERVRVDSVLSSTGRYDQDPFEGGQPAPSRPTAVRTSSPPPYGWQWNENNQLYHPDFGTNSGREAVADVKHVCPICSKVLTDDMEFINFHVDNCLANRTAALKMPNSSSVTYMYDNGKRDNGRVEYNTGGGVLYQHQSGVAKAEAKGTTSRPRNDEGSMVYLVGIPRNVDEVYVIDKFSAVFGDVIRCEIGRITRVGCVTFALREAAETALVAGSMVFSLDDGATMGGNFIEMKITKK